MDGSETSDLYFNSFKSGQDHLVSKQVNSLFKQSWFYFIANILINLAGIVTFPVWTRTLTVEQYGIFSLTVVTITMLGSASKFGFQHAGLRYYSEFSNRKDRATSLCKLYSSISFGSFLIALFICSCSYLIFINLHYPFSGSMHIYLIYAVVLGFLNSLISVQLTFFRAKEDAKIYTIINVIKRYADFIFAWLFVVVLWNFRQLFAGWVVVDISVLFCVIYIAKKEFSFNIKLVSANFLKDAMKYGLPLISFELCSNLLSIGDRYLIDFFLGKPAVGIYSAGYNLGTYGPAFIAVPLRMAVMPRFFNTWEDKGEVATRALLNHVLKFYFMLAIPLAIGMSYLSKDIIFVLASNKFQESATILPYVVISMLIWGPFFIYGAGFYIKKQNLPLALLTFFVTLVNLSLNCLLIPYIHLQGAALSTLISYLLLSVLIFRFSRKYIQINMPWLDIIKFFSLSMLMILPLPLCGKEMNLFILLEKAVIGFMIYVICLMITDIEARKIILQFIRKLNL